MDVHDYNESNISIEEQQRRLESLERRQTKYKWALLIFGSLTFGLVGLLWLIISIGGPQKINYLVLSAKEHSPTEIQGYLQKENTNVVFERNTEKLQDSLLKQAVYEPQIIEVPTPSTEKAEHEMAYASQAPEKPIHFVSEKKQKQPRWSFDEEFEPTPTFAPNVNLDIRGKAEVGKQLLFTVSGYEEALNYSLEFQNGHIQRGIGETTLFTYKKPGIHKVRLWVEDSEGNRKKIERIVNISENSPVPKQLVDNTPTDEPLPLKEKKEVLETKTEATASKAPPSKVAKAASGPLEIAKQMPSFPGGTVILKKYLDLNLRYPEQALESGIEGRIYARFVVQADGSITDTRIMRGLGYGCDEEVLRLISRMPKWIPGHQNGKPVPVYYTLPVNFKQNQ